MKWDKSLDPLHALRTTSSWDIANYYTLNSLTLFWLAESVQWSFEISARDVITCRLYNNHVKDTRSRVIMSCMTAVHDFSKGNHVKFARFVFLLSVKKQKHEFNFFRSIYNKTIIRFGFCDIQNNQGLGKSLSRPWLFWISQKTSSNNCLE